MIWIIEEVKYWNLLLEYVIYGNLKDAIHE